MIDYRVDLVYDLLRRHNLTEREFCAACGVPLDTIERMKAKDGGVLASDVYKIVYILNVSMDTFYNHNVVKDIDIDEDI